MLHSPGMNIREKHMKREACVCEEVSVYMAYEALNTQKQKSITQTD